MSYTIGLDFGTSFSTISYLNPKTGLPEVIDVEGAKQTPSIVSYGETEGEIFVGRAAANRLEDAGEKDNRIFEATFKSIKRDLTTPLHSLPGDRTVRPVDIVSDFIRYMKKYAEEHCFNKADSVTKLRLTYPIAFNGIEKKILKDAAILAGFGEKNVEMLFEPVAAALGYAATGFNLGRNILVYDLGGGTFDLSLVHRHDHGTVEPRLEPVGAVGCAGDDFDLAIYRHWEEQLFSEHKHRFHQKAGKVNNQVLLECRKAKEKLSDQAEVRYAKYFEKEGFNFKAEKLSREKFEHLITPLVARQIDLTRDMLRQAKAENIEIDTILLIGSATYTPLVRSELEKLFQEEELPLTLTKTMHAATAVALGALVDGALDAKDSVNSTNTAPTNEPAPQATTQNTGNEDEKDVDILIVPDDEYDDDVIIVPDDEDDLKAAVDRCSGGETIKIRKGTYYIDETIEVYESITITGATENASDVQLIACDDVSPVIELHENAEIAYCEITNNGGTVVEAHGIMRPVITHCRISGDSDGCGNGIVVYSDECLIEYCSRSDNASDGIEIWSGGASAVIDSCEIYNNRDHGVFVRGTEHTGIFGVFASIKNFTSPLSPGKATIQDCTFTDNGEGNVYGKKGAIVKEYDNTYD